MLRYAIAIFLGGFLLFAVQPLAGKSILPWYGGSAAVWTTCMLFFQALLLAGYGYAHLVATALPRRAQALLHAAVLLAAAATLPILAGGRPAAAGLEDPTGQILGLLAGAVGLPTFALATTSPLLQAWFAATRPGRSPYRLYALSNAGSLLALLSYPTALEPLLGAGALGRAWSLAFAGFAMVSAACALELARAEPAGLAPARAAAGPAAAAPAAPSPAVRLLWVALPAAGSVMLLAVTNQICLDVAVVPFLWILPLALYLLSFVICFDRPDWYLDFRAGFFLALATGAIFMCSALFTGADMKIAHQVAVFAAGLFLCCMVCHGELVRLKPGPRHLTSFYLAIAVGGALGGLFAGVVAPTAFDAYYELHLGLLGCAALAAFALWRDRWRALLARGSWRERASFALALAGLAALGLALERHAFEGREDTLVSRRNFYGVLRVEERDRETRDHRLVLSHGRIVHGYQYVAEARRRERTSYYGPESGAGLVLAHLPRASGLRVGVVGLGVGTIAAYGRAGDRYRFYELNPEVARLATSRFTYLAGSPAACEVILGDGRLSLEREPPGALDVLVLDAFSGDAPPVHLLTREAFEIYRRALAPEGAILVNVTNRYVDLHPVARGAAERLGLRCLSIASSGNAAAGTYSCDWAILTRNEALLEAPRLRETARRADPGARAVLWTDDTSDLLRLLKKTWFIVKPSG